MAPYVHFLVALAIGCFAAYLGAFPGLLILAMPGTEDNRITIGLVALGAVPGTGAAALAFWIAGRRAPLRASFLRTAPAALAALIVFLWLAWTAARTSWLTGNGTLVVMLALLATVGYLPFRCAARR